MTSKKIIFCCICITAISAHTLSAAEYAGEAQKLFSHDITAASGYKYNRTLNDTLPFFIEYSLLFNGNFNFRTGVSFNLLAPSINGYYFDLIYRNILIKGLCAGVKFSNYNYVLYDRGDNSIIPFVMWDNGLYVLLGVSFHFLAAGEDAMHNIFHYSSTSYEPGFFYAAGYTFNVLKNIYTLKVEINNHDRFYTGTNAYIGIAVKNVITFQKNFTVFCDFELRNSGAIALASNFYVFMLTAGITWRIEH